MEKQDKESEEYDDEGKSKKKLERDRQTDRERNELMITSEKETESGYRLGCDKIMLSESIWK